MKVGFYFDASHLRDFSILKFNSGTIGISGTDSSFFRVVDGLAKRGGIEIHLFAKNIDEFPGVTFTKVSSREQAITEAKKAGIDFFVFNLKTPEETRIAIRHAEQEALNLVVWAQNPIENTLLHDLAICKAVLKIVYVEGYDLNHTRHKKGFYKGVVIPNGVEKEVYVKQEVSVPDNLNIFYLGSLTPSKGFHHIAQAWPQVLKEVPAAKLLVIGSGKLYNNHAKLGKLGIADDEYEKQLTPFIGRNADELRQNNVECYGLLNRNEIIDIIYKSKVACINPNIYGSLESCSVSSLEVQICGTPVIAGKAGGNLNTILDNKTGLLVKDHEKELPAAIIKLLTNDALNLKMRKAARNYILGKYEMSLVIDKWEDFFHKLKQGFVFPSPKITPELAEAKLYAKEAIRIFNKVLGK